MTSPPPRNIGDAYSHGIIVDRKSLFLVGDIDEEMLRKAQIGLALLDGGRKPITIYLTSTGGSVDVGFGIYDAIKGCSSPTHIVVRGYAYSMAVAILQAGRRRYITPESLLMVHQIRGSIARDLVQNHTRTVAAWEHSNDRMAAVIADRMGVSLPIYKKKYLLDTYFTASESVSAGLADAVFGG